jgi:hypothetical protein
VTTKRGVDGLIKAGEIPLIKTLAKKFRPPTRAQINLVDAALAIQAEPDAVERAYMARQLVLCTLPHSDPGDVPQWTRRTGTGILGLVPGRDIERNETIGLPYGSIPRLLLFWIITEAVRTKSRRLVLGRSLNEFMRAVGLNPYNGRGKRSDSRRLKDQMRRLFQCKISFQVTGTDPSGAKGEAWRGMEIAPDGELWWHPHPEQAALWESWILLGENFFNAVLASPVPVDMRALRAIKRSPLALDLYALISYRAFVIVQKKLPPQFLSWEQLRRQLGTDYGDVKDFKKEATAALRKIAAVYPGLKITKAKGGFTIHTTRLAVPQKPSDQLPG